MPLYILFLVSFFVISCTSTIQKTGMIESDKFSSKFEGLNKLEIIKILGEPSSKDNLNNSFIDISETINKRNIFSNKVISRNVYVIKFGKGDYFTSINSYDINKNNEVEISKKTTSDEVLKTGWIEKIFGGVGKKQTLTSIPTANVGN